ncbi:MAG: hypothetical protein SAJ37_21630 [Oscillatoria sp. PMC 1068.18]|nr:hypothetical protein [Oscillatoria sp. PMC 1068.18]
MICRDFNSKTQQLELAIATHRSTAIADLVGCVLYCNSHNPTDRLLVTHHAHKFFEPSNPQLVK